MNLEGSEVPLFVLNHDRIVAKKDRVVANDDPNVTSEDPMVSNDDGTASTEAVYFISECRVDSSELDFTRLGIAFCVIQTQHKMISFRLCWCYHQQRTFCANGQRPFVKTPTAA